MRVVFVAWIFFFFGLSISTQAQNDPFLASQWHHANMNSSALWSKITDCRGIHVGVFDTGVRQDHPDLSANMIVGTGYNFTGGRYGSPHSVDNQGHGTMVAGFIAAEGNNGVGVAGVCWRASMASYKVLEDSGAGSFFDAANAIYYAYFNGVDVANHSYGAPATANYFNNQFAPQIFLDALEYVGSRGMINVIAAGNDGHNYDAWFQADTTRTVIERRGRRTYRRTEVVAGSRPTMPTNTVLVAASTNARERASFSAYGGRFVQVTAPGHNVTSTNRNGGYSTASGTSFSSPITAGAVTAIWASNPGWSASQVVAELYRLSPQPAVNYVEMVQQIVGYEAGTPYEVCTRSRRVGRRTVCSRWETVTPQTPIYGEVPVTRTNYPMNGLVVYGELNFTNMN